MEFNVYGATKIKQSDDNKEFISYIKTILPPIIEKIESLFDCDVYKWYNKPQIKMSNRWNSNSAYVEFVNKKYPIVYQIRLSDHWCDGFSNNFIGDIVVDHINKNYDVDFDMLTKWVDRHNEDEFSIIEEKQREYISYINIVNNLPDNCIVASYDHILCFFDNIKFSFDTNKEICDSIETAKELHNNAEYFNKQQLYDSLAEIYEEYIF